MYLTAHMTDNIISVKAQLSRQTLSLCNSTSNGKSICSCVTPCRPQEQNLQAIQIINLVEVHKCLLQLSPGKREGSILLFSQGLFEKGQPICLQITLDFCATVTPLKITKTLLTKKLESKLENKSYSI